MTRPMTNAARGARPGRSGQAGFTLIELMVAGTLVTIVLLMTIQLALTVIGDMKAQREAHALERSARAPADYIVDLLRGAAGGTTTGNVQDVTYCTTANGLTYSASNPPVVGMAMTNGGTANPDSLTLLSSTGSVTSLRTAVDSTSTSATLTDATGFAAGDFLLITDGSVGRMIKTKTLAGNVVTFDAPLTCAGFAPMPTYPIGTLVLRGRIARFQLATIDGVSYLTIDPDGNGPAAAQPMAEGIEDLQVAIGVDADGNGVLAAGEWHYSAANTTAPALITAGRWRAMRLTVVAKELVARPGSTTVSGRPAAEDRAAGSVDMYRRRVLTTMTEVRNLEMP
jgi:type II secretory pathway pseudopilin PulG